MLVTRSTIQRYVGQQILVAPLADTSKRFAAVIMRIRDPKTTALIFASGKMVVTGAKSEDDSKLASRKYARIIQKLGFNAKFTDFKIQNIVGSCDIKFPIRLEGLASKHHPFSSYEPELFPGLIYRMIKPKIVLLIFVSGKIVLTGAKVREEIYQAFETIYPTLNGKQQSTKHFGMTHTNMRQTSARSKSLTSLTCWRIRCTNKTQPVTNTWSALMHLPWDYQSPGKQPCFFRNQNVTIS